MTIRTILVANRSEIAARVLRTATVLGYRTVAVYSDADAGAPHVELADVAVRIGPAPVGESYLDPERILAAARESGADAIHPGYGFLSENAAFARACEAAGVTFIGPPVDAIELMGNKAAAKRRMIEAGVPCVPGYEGEEQSDDVFRRAADTIGYPVMVKAAAGGGGRGMRLVAAAEGLPRALALARSEAENAFGSGELILEKAVVRPRHVEIQVFADTHGNVIHLGERDCSVQRRHQKVIEESPCPVLTPELRQQMGAAAVEAARSIGYRGAGTVEFLLDDRGSFYFLEMNTRLQVEHPVTELVTGLDLVALQIQVAEGRPLGISQTEVALRGHAIEVRLYAEDPAQDYLPSTGHIDLWVPPAGDGIRVDAGIESGLEVSPFYDPMLAKIIAWGETRDLARRRLVTALRQTALFGPFTNREMLIAALTNPTFIGGGATTAFLAEERPDPAVEATSTMLEKAAVAAVLECTAETKAALEASVGVANELVGWGSSGILVTHYRYAVAEEEVDVVVSSRGRGALEVRAGDQTFAVSVVVHEAPRASLFVDGRRRHVLFSIPAPGRIHVSLDGEQLTVRNRLAEIGDDAEGPRGGAVLAPMHGLMLEVNVAVGDTVKRGDQLGVLEAMKMQHEILAEVDGVVTEVLRKAGDQVAADDRLLQIGIEEAAAPD